jgi:hypothetical protein
MGHTASAPPLLERNQTDFVAINLRCGWDGGNSPSRDVCPRDPPRHASSLHIRFFTTRMEKL